MRISLTDALTKAVTAHRLRRYDEAEALYADILAAHPMHPDVNHNKGLLLKRKGQLEEALVLFKQALNANSKDTPQFWVSYIDLLIYLERREEVEQAFLQARRNGIVDPNLERLSTHFYGSKAPLDLDILNGEVRRAIEVFTTGDMEDTLQFVDNLLSKHPNSAALYNIQGAAYAAQKKFNNAVKSYRKAISLLPEFADAYNNLGVSLRAIGDITSAIVNYQRAIDINPLYTEAYYNVGNALFGVGKVKEAIHYYLKVIKLKPDHAKAYNNLGVAIKEDGDIDEALRLYKKALLVCPNYTEALTNMALIFKDKGDTKQAISTYHQALRINPHSAEARHLLASLKGQTPKSAPRDYVEVLFDRYASKFDVSLVAHLDYTVPKLLKDAIIHQIQNKSLGSVLDIGCGTGLVGQEVRRYSQRLEGVDVSSKMLMQAQSKDIYDELIHSDLIDYLQEKELDFDYYICADVFIYLGDLTQLFNLIKSRNKRSGKLVFSTEHKLDHGYTLQKSGRFSHSKNYIEVLCSEFDYKISYFEYANLRKENNEYLDGALYILDF